MNYYDLKFADDADQTKMTEIVKASGGDTIQTSSGLLAKSPLDQSELEKELSPVSQHITITEIKPENVAEDESFSKDAKVFMGIE